jgi:integrase
MKTQSELKVFKSGDYEYIYVYYKLNRSLIRINTKNKFIKGSMQKDLFYNNNHPDQRRLNKKTHELKQRIDTYIMVKLKELFPYVDQKECLQFIQTDFSRNNVMDGTPYRTNRYAGEKTVFEYLKEFNDQKFKDIGNAGTMKTYKALLNALIDYQATLSKPLTFDLMNNESFLIDFRNYLATKHDGLTEGNLADNTINKRISNLKSFYKWLEKKEIFSFRKDIYAFTVPKYETEVIALSKAEISQLLALKNLSAHRQKIIDVFILNCFMGLRFSDLSTLNKGSFIVDEDGDYIYSKTDEKTNSDIIVPVLDTPLKILQKYDFKLPVLTGQYFNRELKEILKDNKLFEEIVTHKRIVNNKIKSVKVKKRTLISSHTCRRTFITLSISENVPLNAIMAATGHRRITTLQRYIKNVHSKEKFKNIDI